MTTPSSNVGADASRGYTPGPWFWDGDTWLTSKSVPSHSFSLILYYTIEDDGLHGTPADKALIAAAPELLEALESAEAVIDYAASILWNCRPEGRRARPAKVDASLRQFRAAIAKAKGGAK